MATTVETLRARRQARGTDDASRTLSIGEMVSKAASNLPSSAVKFGSDLIEPFAHPINTWDSLTSLGRGLQELAVRQMAKGMSAGVAAVGGTPPELPTETPDAEAARAVGRFFANRYGSIEAVKHAVAEDPVGVLGDVAMVLTGGGMALARAPGMAGKVGQIARSTGQTIDPLNIAGKALKTSVLPIGASNIAGKVAAPLLGLTTGAGSESISQAYRAGREGGARQKALTENMRGVEPFEDVAQEAVDALKTSTRAKSAKYKDRMQALKLDQRAINFDPILVGFNQFMESKTFEGMSELSMKGQSKLRAVRKIIGDWQKSPGLHNAKGLDMLKRRIDGEYPTGINPGDEAGVVTEIRNMVKREILEQVPEYGSVMKAYEEATKLEKEMRRTLSLGQNASADSTLRKLQSVMRNNVNSNFGNRLKLLETLESAGDVLLAPKIAGQALSSATPRGLQATVAGASTLGGASQLLMGLDPTLLALLPMQSPRLMGEAALKVGQAGRRMEPLTGPAKTVGMPTRATGEVTTAIQDDEAARRRQQILDMLRNR